MSDAASAYGFSLALIALLVYFARRNRAQGWRRKRRPTLGEVMGGGGAWRLTARLEGAPGQPIETQLQRLAEKLEEFDPSRPAPDVVNTERR